MVKGECHFRQEWLDPEQFPEFSGWLAKISDTKAKCLKCNNRLPIDLINMGKHALYSHIKSKTHQSSVKHASSHQPVFNSFFTNKKSSDVNNNKGVEGSENQLNQSTVSVNTVITEKCCDISNISVNNKSCITSYMTNEDVTRAEIIFSFCHVSKQGSLRCFSEISDCFPIMFKDSEIAKKFKMHKDKLSYSITYGLGPYFQKVTANEVRNCDYFAISFDESLNKIAQKAQMDLIVRYWKNNEFVETKYLTSCFLNDVTAVGLLEGFKSGLLELNLDANKIIQVGMDGPNVNLKMLSDLKEFLTAENPDSPKIIEIGTCSLHVVNGSFKTGHAKTGWEIDKYLRASYYLFKDFPTRRGAFMCITQSYDFPLKYCSIRWIENSRVMERAKSILSKIKAYVQAVYKKPPKSKNFDVVKEFIKDDMLEAKLAFMISVSLELESFLTIYQSNDCLLPFMHNDLFVMMKNLHSRIIKSDYMKEVKNVRDLLSLDLDKKEILCDPSKVDVGISAKSVIKKLVKPKETDILHFQMQCQKFILEMCKKLKEKCPLGMKFVRGASCLSPLVMLVPDLAKTRVRLVLEELSDLNHFGSIATEKIEKEYIHFISNENVIKELNKFSRKKDKLDAFLMKLCTEQECSKHFVDFVKRILVVFHGNAAVERSFSFNKEFLVENLQEHSLIAQRSVHDFIKNFSKVTDICISKDMITAFKNASYNRVEALKEKKAAEDSARKRKRELQNEINTLHAKKKEALDTLTYTETEIEMYDRELKKLEK